MKKLIIIGSGGHAKVLLSTMLISGMEIIGITEQDPLLFDETIMDVRVVGNDSKIFEFLAEDIMLVNGIGSTKAVTRRKDIFEELSAKNYKFASVIHLSAVIAPAVVLGEGVQIMAGSVIQTDSVIGSNVIINTKVSVDHDCVICKHVHLAPGVTLSGNVYVGECTHIGTGAVVVQGISIGKNCTIGAGTVVLRDVPDSTTVVGVPGRVVFVQ
ncbi:MAG: acetyltransferase [Bacillota bacterium]